MTCHIDTLTREETTMLDQEATMYIPFAEWLINSDHEGGSWADIYQGVLRGMGASLAQIREQHKDSDYFAVAQYVCDLGDPDSLVTEAGELFEFEGQWSPGVPFPVVSDDTYDVLCRLYWDVWFDSACGLHVALDDKAWGTVYIIRAKDWYKIGFSSNPRRRLNNLQVGHHEKLDLIATSHTPTPKEGERLLHNAFAHRPRRGEWFRLTRKDVRGIVEKSKHGNGINWAFLDRPAS